MTAPGGRGCLGGNPRPRFAIQTQIRSAPGKVSVLAAVLVSVGHRAARACRRGAPAPHLPSKKVRPRSGAAAPQEKRRSAGAPARLPKNRRKERGECPEAAASRLCHPEEARWTDWRFGRGSLLAHPGSRCLRRRGLWQPAAHSRPCLPWFYGFTHCPRPLGGLAFRMRGGARLTTVAPPSWLSTGGRSASVASSECF